MSNEYRHKHYVPEWYQKRFLPLGRKDQELLYLDRTPGTFTDPHGVEATRAIEDIGRRAIAIQADSADTAAIRAAVTNAVQ